MDIVPVQENKTNQVLSKYSEQELLKKTQDEMDKFQFTEAQIYCQEVLNRNPDSLEALEICASLCIDTANFINAKQCLERAISLAPDEGFSKYFSMGQILEGEEALQCYNKGIEILQKLVNLQSSEKAKHEKFSNGSQSKEEDKPENLIRKLSSAYCALAELYTTDLCDEDNAEAECVKYIKSAIKADRSNPEGFQQYASFYLIKGEEKKAKTMIGISLYLWSPKHKEYSKTDIDDPELLPSKKINIDPSSLTPATRLAAAKILIELKQYEEAEDVLDGVIAENDEDVYTWYLLGLCHYFQGSDHMEEAKINFEKAMNLNTSNPCSEEGIVDHMTELLNELSAIDTNPQQSDNNQFMAHDGSDISDLDAAANDDDMDEDDSDEAL